MIFKIARGICASIASQFSCRSVPEANVFVPHIKTMILPLFLVLAGESIGEPENCTFGLSNCLRRLWNTIAGQQALTLVLITKEHRKGVKLHIPYYNHAGYI
jgi:hypothetical protein